MKNIKEELSLNKNEKISDFPEKFNKLVRIVNKLVRIVLFLFLTIPVFLIQIFYSSWL
jgi:hypothetical protein